MAYRTKTYIAADWDGDQDAVKQLYDWNNSDHWDLSFVDAHEVTQSRDSSLNCTIKRSLAMRMNLSKTFVLIVGKNTKTLRSGSCQYCDKYYAPFSMCMNNYTVDLRSYIEFECEKAIKDDLKIIVLYNDIFANKVKCPDCIKDYGVHIPMRVYKGNGEYGWNYQAIKKAFE